MPCFVRLHHSLVHPLLDQGMVLRQLDDPPVAHQVGPAVAHVSDGRFNDLSHASRYLALLQDGLIAALWLI
jgi:hypothetical protein